jgi:predicted amidohydrolase YtcJ
MFADMVLLNGKIVTVDSRDLITEAVAVRSGKFLFAGENEKAKMVIEKDTQVLDLKGKTVIPGFIDSHGHLAQSAVQLRHIDCSLEGGVKSINDLQDKIAERAKTTPKGEWIQGDKLDDSKLTEKRLPTKWDLDKVAPDHPVFLTYAAWHIYVVNSKAFEICNINMDVEDPPGGKLGRDSVTNELTGIIYEQAVKFFQPSFNYDELVDGIRQLSKRFVTSGITCFYDSYFPRGHLGVGSWIKAYQELLSKGELPLRIRLDINDQWLTHVEKLGLLPGFGNDMLKIGGIKISVDGAISGFTAAVAEPYLHKPDYYGMMTITMDQLRSIVMSGHKAGLRLSAHVNGERAIHAYLDAIEEALHEYPRKDARHRCIHCSIVTPHIISRMKHLGILPTIFGSFIYFVGDKMLPAYGPERAERMFAARSLLDAGLTVSAHSDYSGAPYAPLLGIHTLVNRRTLGGRVYGSKQQISVMEALKLYTINAAYHSFEENTLGSIEPGKLADMVVLGKDLLTIEKDSIKDIPIDMVILGGSVVYKGDG